MEAARRCLLFASTVIVVAVVAGCTSTGQWTLSKMLSNPDYADGTEDVEEWVEDAGSEGRAGRTVDKERDPLGLRNIFMSEKALSIERNLGIE